MKLINKNVMTFKQKKKKNEKNVLLTELLEFFSVVNLKAVKVHSEVYCSLKLIQTDL